jgi:hypothetical protein
MDALAAFLNCSIRQADNNRFGQARTVIDFDFDDDPIKSDDGAGIDAS